MAWNFEKPRTKKRLDFSFTKSICYLNSASELTGGPLLIQSPLSEAVHQPDLVVLVTRPPGVLEDLDARRQAYVVLVVVAPGGQRELQLTVELRQVVQVGATQRLQAAGEAKSETKFEPLQEVPRR